MKNTCRTFGLLVLFLTSYLTLAASSSLKHYALIIDAGSTGSRLHLFEYSQSTAVPQIKDIFSESTSPGLSSFAKNPAGAGASLKTLLDDALQQLQAKKIDPQTVKISVLATAGMRLLPENMQKAIHENVIQYLQKNYSFSSVEVITISGKMEGIFGWLDLNYLLKNFDSNRDITQGSIDIGGSSTQIAFTTTDPIPVEDQVNLTIGNNTYKIFSKSFLGLGLSESIKYLNQQTLAASCYPAHYPLNSQDAESFNFPGCENLFAQLIHQHQVAKQIPTLNQKHFIAYSGAYHIDHFFKLGSSPNKLKFQGRVQEVCSMTWETLKAKYPQEPEKYLATDCPNGVYLSELLYHSYQLQGQQITIEKQINQVDISWTLGALLYEIEEQKKYE